jgi:acyl carrier protein
VNAGQKWEGLATELQLSGWTQKRRVVVLRRPLREGVADEKNSQKKAAKQMTLDLPEATYQGVLYEYAVLVTSMQDEVLAIAQHYRDRGDSENNFDGGSFGPEARIPLALTVTIDSDFEQLNIDSMDAVEILFVIENEFDIKIPDEEVRSVRNVRQMGEGVEKLAAAKTAGAPKP